MLVTRGIVGQSRENRFGTGLDGDDGRCVSVRGYVNDKEGRAWKGRGIVVHCHSGDIGK